MNKPQDFETRFTEVFQPIFLWGVGAFELILIIYTLYMEFVTGMVPLCYPRLTYKYSNRDVWAVLAVLITLAVVGIKNRTKRAKH